MGPNNFEYQISQMPQFQNTQSSGASSGASSGLGVFSNMLGLAEFLYNVGNNERVFSANAKYNALAQSNFENQFQIMSKDMQKAGFNPSALLGGAQNSSSPSFNNASQNKADLMTLATLMDSMTNAKLAESQERLNNANADKSSAEAGNETNKYSHDEYMFNLNRWHELNMQEKEYQLKTNLQSYIQDFEKSENKKNRENALDAIYAKANYDNQLQNRLYDLKNQLNINDAKLREVLLDKEVEYKILTMQIQGNIDKDKLSMELAQRFKELGVEMSERAYETLSRSLDNLANCVSNIFGASIISGGSSPSKVIIPPSKFNKWD